MDRLFGRSKTKKSTTSPASPSTVAVTTEDEGFAVVSTPVQAGTTSTPSPYPNIGSSYPILKPELPNGNTTGTPTVPSSSNSSGASAYLDGIPFVLSSKCNGGTEHDNTLAKVESIAERIRSVDWNSTQYDFRLEKSVLSQEISGSLGRVQIE